MFFAKTLAGSFLFSERFAAEIRIPLFRFNLVLVVSWILGEATTDRG